MNNRQDSANACPCSLGANPALFPISYTTSRAAGDEERFGHLICRPADCSTGHSCHDPRLQAPEESLPTVPSLNDCGSLPQSLDIPQLSILCRASRLQQRLDHIQWCSNTSRDTTSNSSCETMSVGVVLSGRVEDFDRGFVDGELDGSEGNSHREGSWIRHIEGS